MVAEVLPKDSSCSEMKISATPLLILLLTVVLTGAQANLRSATIDGTVKNVATGEPLVDVRVTVTPESTPGMGIVPAATGKSATTDAEGKFTITAVAPGQYTVAATRTLFFRARRGAGPVVLTVGEGQRLTGVQILLSPTAVIAGRVIDERREPLRAVRVEALRREYRDGQRLWTPAGQNTTDDRGEYRLFNLAPGTYYIRATQNTSTPLYYPGVASSQNAVPVSVDVGSEAGAINIEMRQLPEYIVQLKLGGVPPGSMANFAIRRKDGIANDQQIVRAEPLADNTYRLKMTTGSYDIFAQVNTPTTAQPRVLTHAANIPVTIGNADQDLGTVVIPATVPVTGRIVVPDPVPFPLALERITLMMRALDLPVPLTATVRGNTTPPGFNSDGTFTLANVALGRYQLLLSGLPPDTYFISAKTGTREVLDSGFLVDGTQNPLQLIVGGSEAVGSVTGTVVNSLGDPVVSSTVVLVPTVERRGNPAAFRNTASDQSGNFSIRSVLPGDYRVLAWADLEPGLYMDPEFLQNFETRGEVVRVQRASRNTLTVRVIPAP